jgi:hypothetical protein
MSRGKCDFGRKAVFAHAAGAKGVVVIDTVQKAGAPALVMQTAVAAARELSLPVVSVSFANAQKWVSGFGVDDIRGGMSDGATTSSSSTTSTVTATGAATATIAISHPVKLGSEHAVYEIIHEFGANGNSLGLGISFPTGVVTKVAKACTLNHVKVGDTLLGMNHRSGIMSPAAAFLPVYRWSMPQFLGVLQHVKAQPGGAIALRFFKGPGHDGPSVARPPNSDPACSLMFRDADVTAGSRAVLTVPCTSTKLGFLRAVQTSPVLFRLHGSACSGLPENGQWLGKAVLAADGIWANCSTLQAAIVAQDAGASALIIAKDVAAVESVDNGAVSVSGIHMPVVTVSQMRLLRMLGDLAHESANTEVFVNLSPSVESQLKHEQQQAWSRHVAEVAELGSESEEEALLLNDLGQHAMNQGDAQSALQHFEEVVRLVQLNTAKDATANEVAHEIHADPNWLQDTMVPPAPTAPAEKDGHFCDDESKSSSTDMDAYLDIVVPSCPKDFSALRRCVEAAARYAHGIRRIFVISATAPPITMLDRQKTEALPVPVIWVPEGSFPFSPADCRKVLTGSTRCGWYVQQLYKLYSSFLLPPLQTPEYFNHSRPCAFRSAASKGKGVGFVLVLDSDTILLRPTRFVDMTKLGPTELRVAGLYATGSEYHQPYFDHMERLLPGLSSAAQAQPGERHLSGIAHHMVFHTEVLKALFRQVETHHQVPFWRAFLASAAHQSNDTVTSLTLSGASEYEIYFSFARQHFPSSMQLISRRWANAKTIPRDSDYDFVSLQSWMRRWVYRSQFHLAFLADFTGNKSAAITAYSRYAALAGQQSDHRYHTQLLGRLKSLQSVSGVASDSPLGDKLTQAVSDTEWLLMRKKALRRQQHLAECEIKDQLNLPRTSKATEDHRQGAQCRYTSSEYQPCSTGAVYRQYNWSWLTGMGDVASGTTAPLLDVFHSCICNVSKRERADPADNVPSNVPSWWSLEQEMPRLLRLYAAWHARMRQKYHEYYMQDSEAATGVKSANQPPAFRAIVYSCRHGGQCEGLGDRFKGLVSAFYLAVLTGRLLFIDADVPSRLEEMLRPPSCPASEQQPTASDASDGSTSRHSDSQSGGKLCGVDWIIPTLPPALQTVLNDAPYFEVLGHKEQTDNRTAAQTARDGTANYRDITTAFYRAVSMANGTDVLRYQGNMWHVPQMFAYSGMGSTCESQFCSLHAQGKAQTLLARIASDVDSHSPPFWKVHADDLKSALTEAKMSSESGSTEHVQLMRELESVTGPMRTAFELLFRPSPALECGLQVYALRHFLGGGERPEGQEEQEEQEGQEGHVEELGTAGALIRLLKRQMRGTTCIQIRAGGGMGSTNDGLDPIRHKMSALHLFSSSARNLMRHRQHADEACLALGTETGDQITNCNDRLTAKRDRRRWLVVTDDPAAATRMRELGSEAGKAAVGVMTTVEGSSHGVVHISRTDTEKARKGLVHVFLDWLLLTRCQSTQFVASRSGFSLTAAALMSTPKTLDGASDFASCCIVADRDLKPLKVALPNGMVMHNMSARDDNSQDKAKFNWLVSDHACKKIFVGM